MTDKPESDFERACAAFAVGANAALTKVSVRRGVLAALREMREPGEGQLDYAASTPTHRLVAKAHWQAMLDELIRQGEQ